jgi:two-component system CheB/CheR fusion protein
MAPALPYDSSDGRIDMRMLVADDTTFVLEFLKSMLEKQGHVVTSVTNGRQLLEKLGDGSDFDMVLTDNDMPQMSGLAALSQIRIVKTTAQMPVIVLSARDVSEEVQALNGIYIEKGQGKNDDLWAAIAQIEASLR